MDFTKSVCLSPAEYNQFPISLQSDNFYLFRDKHEWKCWGDTLSYSLTWSDNERLGSKLTKVKELVLYQIIENTCTLGIGGQQVILSGNCCDNFYQLLWKFVVCALSRRSLQEGSDKLIDTMADISIFSSNIFHKMEKLPLKIDTLAIVSINLPGVKLQDALMSGLFVMEKLLRWIEP